MAISRPQKITVTLFAILTVAALGATILTWNWGNPGGRLRTKTSDTGKNEPAVDTRPLDAAQQLAQLALTRTEKGYAEEALRLGDYSVDFAFAAAMREAASAPAPATAATREIMARLKNARDAVIADSVRISTLTVQLARSSGGSRDELQQQLDLAAAQAELDQDDADDAHQDLIRAGGDRLASIQRLRAQHDTSTHAAGAPASGASGSSATAAAAPSIEQTASASILNQVAAWRSLNAKRRLLDQARQDAINRAVRLTEAHDTLEKQVVAEKARQQILHQKGHNAGNVALARSANNAKRPAGRIDTAPSTAGAAAVPATALSFLQDLTVDQKDLSEFDKRIENEQDLATVYAAWSSDVLVQQQRFLHGIFVAAFWVLLIALFVVGANEGVQRIFSEVTLQHRRLHTLRTVMLFGVQLAGIVLILLMLFGMPNNFATVIALAGAGLALALQDFILAFLGWFVLMGKDGIRPGDWVEINGVGGEVLEVGVFQTVLLESSNLSESAHPTGRKVSFLNSFAVEGHFFNFSTSGQWLWDELEVQVADGTDPYAVAEAIQRLAASETAANADVAEQEWRRVVPSHVRQPFSAVPSVSVRPSGAGVSVLVRYLTRASDRPELRARMYRAMIELVHGKSAAGTAGRGSAA